MRRMRVMAICGLVLAVVAGTFGGGLGVLFHYLGGGVSPLVDSQLDRHHATTMAAITELEYVSHANLNSRHPWKVTFRFAAPDETVISTVGYTLDQSFANKAAGDLIEVEYAPADPRRARPVGGSASLLPAWVYLVTIGVLVPEFGIGVGMLGLLAVRARNERTLLSYGAATEAEVVGVHRVSYIRMGTRSPYDVYYRFFDHRGIPTDGKDRTYHYAWAEGLRPGDKVAVIYSPASPAASVLWLHGDEVGAERLRTNANDERRPQDGWHQQH
jgi:hypothetical protein